MAEPIKPALTAAEWEHCQRLKVEEVHRFYGSHAAAIKCLHGQPYGFTREEIAFLNRADGLLVSHFRESISPTIEKILALLPPEQPDG